MRPLRVAIVTRRFWPLVGGTEKVLANLAVELARRGCSITVITTRWQARWPSEIRFHEVPVVRLSPPPGGWLATWRYMRALGRWLRAHERDLDVVCVSMLKHEAQAAIRALGGRVPVVLRAERAGGEGDCLWQIEDRLGRRIKDACMKAAAFMAPTPMIQRELEAAGYPRPRIHHVANGVPMPPPRTPAARTAARALLAEANAMLQLPEEAALAVYAGRLTWDTGLASLLAAWPAVLQHRPAAKLWLAGDGPDRAAIRRQIDYQGMDGRVTPIGVFDDIDGLLAAAELLVAPSPEGGSTAILEGMAAGLPVVAADVPANRWLLSDGQEGLLVPPSDAVALADAITRILTQPDLATRLGAAARERAACDFSLAKMADEHLTWFGNIA